MADINRIPRGLTGLLDIKAGATVRQVAEFIQPTIDLLAFYALEKGLKTDSVASAVGAIGAGLTIPIPDSEAWLIYAVGSQFTFAGAANDVALSLRVLGIPLRGGGVSDTPVASAPLTPARAAGAAGMRVVHWTPGQTTILPGGSSIRAQVDDHTGMFLTSTLNLTVAYAQVGSFPGSTQLFA